MTDFFDIALTPSVLEVQKQKGGSLQNRIADLEEQLALET